MKCVVEHEKLNRVPGKEEVNGLKDHRKREKEKSSGSLSLVNDPRFLPLTLLLCYWSCHYNQGRINEGKVNSREDLFLFLRQKINRKDKGSRETRPGVKNRKRGMKKNQEKEGLGVICFVMHHESSFLLKIEAKKRPSVWSLMCLWQKMEKHQKQHLGCRCNSKKQEDGKWRRMRERDVRKTCNIQIIVEWLTWRHQKQQQFL